MSRDRVEEFVEQLGLVVARLGVLVILASVGGALVLSLWRLADERTRHRAYRDTRRCLGREILLGLELLVAGDVIRTVVGSQPRLRPTLVVALAVPARVRPGRRPADRRRPDVPLLEDHRVTPGAPMALTCCTGQLFHREESP
jgi:uncharacterized membrane protein